MQRYLLRLSRWVWLDAFRSEVIEELDWNLSKCLFGQKHRILSELSIRYKLDDIGVHVLFESLAVQGYFVCVKLVHRGEVSVAHPYDNNGQRL